MADNLTNRDGRDDSRINVNQPHEVRYWTGKWGITETTLRAAINAVGVMVKDVETWLKRNGHI